MTTGPEILVKRDGAFATVALDKIDENFAYFGAEDYRIGMNAFARKKKPKFVGR